jgi:ecotin
MTMGLGFLRLTLPLLMVAASAPAVAIPRLDLSGYPAPKPGLKRWVIQPSGLLPKSDDAMVSAHPLDWRVQLIVGKEVESDCNVKRLSGPSLSMQRLPQSSGKALFEVSGPVLVLSTRMACTSEQAKGKSFCHLVSSPI